MHAVARRSLAAAALVSAVASSSVAAPVEYQDAIAADAPLLWYKFGETEGPAVNHGSLGVDFNADYIGTPFRNSGTASGDGAVRFDSSDDYLQSDAVAPESLGGNPTFSIEALFYVVPDGGAALWAPLLHWGASDVSPTMKSVYFSFQNFNVQRMYAGFYNGGLRTGEIQQRGEWHHFVWVREGGDAPANKGSTVYFDGVEVELEDDPDLPSNSGTPNVEVTQFRINRAQDFIRWFTGAIDEIALYDKALTADDVEERYKLILDSPCAEVRCIDYDGGCKSCGNPTGGTDDPTATDALFVLRTAVGTRGCNLCVCDGDGNGSVVSTDALRTLRVAVGQDIKLDCP
jgi:hypothetical protein